MFETMTHQPPLIWRQPCTRGKSTKFDSETLYLHHIHPVPEFMLQNCTSFKLFQAEICNPAGLPSSLTSDTPELLF